MSIFGFLQDIIADERGATAVEYGLILSLIVIAMIGALNSFADAAIAMWTEVEQKSAEAIEKSAG